MNKLFGRKLSSFLVFLFTLLFFIANCTSNVFDLSDKKQKELFKENSNYINRSKFKIKNESNKLKATKAKIIKKDNSMLEIDSTRELISGYQNNNIDDKSFKIKLYTDVVIHNPVVGNKPGLPTSLHLSFTKPLNKDEDSGNDDHDIFKIELRGPSGNSCGMSFVTTFSNIPYDTVDLFYPITPTGDANGTYTVKVFDYQNSVELAPRTIGTFQIDNIQNITITAEPQTYIRGTSPYIDVTTDSATADFMNIKITGPLESATPLSQDVLTCQILSQGMYWTPSTGIANGTYEVKAYLKDYPGVTASTNVVITSVSSSSSSSTSSTSSTSTSSSSTSSSSSGGDTSSSSSTSSTSTSTSSTSSTSTSSSSSSSSTSSSSGEPSPSPTPSPTPSSTGEKATVISTSDFDNSGDEIPETYQIGVEPSSFSISANNRFNLDKDTSTYFRKSITDLVKKIPPNLKKKVIKSETDDELIEELLKELEGYSSTAHSTSFNKNIYFCDRSFVYVDAITLVLDPDHKFPYGKSTEVSMSIYGINGKVKDWSVSITSGFQGIYLIYARKKWDGTDFNGNRVLNGNYKVVIERNSNTSDDLILNFFEPDKGINVINLEVNNQTLVSRALEGLENEYKSKPSHTYLPAIKNLITGLNYSTEPTDIKLFDLAGLIRVVINNTIQEEQFIKQAIERAKADKKQCILSALQSLLSEMPNARTAINNLPTSYDATKEKEVLNLINEQPDTRFRTSFTNALKALGEQLPPNLTSVHVAIGKKDDGKPDVQFYFTGGILGRELKNLTGNLESQISSELINSVKDKGLPKFRPGDEGQMLYQLISSTDYFRIKSIVEGDIIGTLVNGGTICKYKNMSLLFVKPNGNSIYPLTGGYQRLWDLLTTQQKLESGCN